MQQVLHLVVSAPDTVQLNPTLKRDGNANRKHEQNGVHEQSTLLKKRHY
jgi:hypothetical protein